MEHFRNDKENPAHVESAQLRADAIRAQLELAVSFCHLVPTELEYGHTDEARSLIEKAQHVVDEADKHIHEQSHVPSEEVPKLQQQLRDLELLVAESQRKFAA